MKRLENLVLRDLSVAMRLNLPMDELLLQDFDKAIKVETGRVKAWIMKSVTDTLQTSESRRFVRQCQQQVVTLSGKLLRYSDVQKLTSDIDLEQFTATEVMCHYLYQCLNDLLMYIEHHFSQYVFWTAYVPQQYLAITRHTVTNKVADIDTWLIQHNIDSETQAFACKPLRLFLDASNPVTFADVRYILNLQDELIQLMQRGHDQMDESLALNNLLLRLNYNSHDYFLFHTRRVEEAMEQVPTILEKLQVLHEEAKKLRLVEYDGVMPYKLQRKSLVTLLCKWITDESHDLELQFRMTEITSTKDDHDKYNLAISVAILAGAIRALIGSKAVPKENITVIGKLLTRCFTTLRSGGTFSENSFHQSYYGLTEHTRKVLIEIFTKAINWLKNPDNFTSGKRKT